MYLGTGRRRQRFIVLFFVGIFLFAIWGIIEEKEKKLFFITRVTDKGILHDILARMAALGISCVIFCVPGVSYWRKNFMQTILIGAVIFVVPLALYAQGIDFMKYLTVYPVYAV